MKNLILVLFIICWSVSCINREEGKSTRILKTKDKLDKTNNSIITTKKNIPDKYVGIWIHQDSARFILIDISDYQNIIYYSYLNIAHAIGSKSKNLGRTILKSPGYLKNVNDSSLVIQAGKYRFAYRYKNDTIFLISEDGYILPCIRTEIVK
jgi:hypothetical protein